MKLKITFIPNPINTYVGIMYNRDRLASAYPALEVIKGVKYIKKLNHSNNP
jgi:hypothetical protein